MRSFLFAVASASQTNPRDTLLSFHNIMINNNHFSITANNVDSVYGSCSASCIIRSGVRFAMPVRRHHIHLALMVDGDGIERKCFINIIYV